MNAHAATLRRTHLFAGVASLLLMVCLVACVLLARDRRAAADAVMNAQANLTLGLERDILRNIDIYDLSLRTAAAGLHLLGAEMDDAARQAILFDGSTAARHFRPVVITDGAGNVIHNSSGTVLPHTNIADRPFFAAHRSRDDLGLLTTIRARDTTVSNPYLSLSRRIGNADGSFDGIVAGGLSLDYFDDIFSRFALEPGADIALIGIDGLLVVGVPHRDDAPGRNMTADNLLDRALDQAQTIELATFETTRAVDGLTCLATVRRLGRLPYFIKVEVPLQAVYAGWHDRAWAVGAGLFALTSLSLLLVEALSRELDRRRAAEQRAVAAMAAVKASELRLATYVDHLADGILAIGRNAAGAFVYERVNDAAARILGIRPEDAIGRRPCEVWPEAMARSVERRLHECAQSDTPVHHEQSFDGPDGARVVRFVLAAVRDPEAGGGDVTLLLESLRDVTATVALESKLRQAQRMEAVGQLTAGVAHDFNNMLQAQLGALEMLADEVADMPRAHRLATLALVTNERGASLTHSLLSFSRQQQLAPRPVRLDAMLERLRTMLSRTLETRVELRILVDTTAPAPFVDEAQLESALLNLAINARDAMPAGGTLSIEALAAADREAGVVLAVSDTGIGMPSDVVARACEPFFTTKEVGRSSGLGLSMVQGFVQQSGGDMRIVSQPGQGTRIELRLPQARSAPEALAPSGMEAVSGAGRRILLVDDSPDVLGLMSDLLAEKGFEVVPASSGTEALALLATGRTFDVLVTDYMLPGIDGGELLRRVTKRYPGLPALVLTGYAELDVLAALPERVEVARKPLSGDMLARRIADLLGRTRVSGKTAVAADPA